MTERQYDYLVIGAGVAGAGAVKGIRAVDQDGSIALVGAEADPPAYRPALSKDLWLKDDATLDDQWLLGDDDLRGVDTLTGTTVTSLSPDQHLATTSSGDLITYGKAILATGGAPRHIDGFDEGERVVYFRTVADYRRLQDLAGNGSRVVVVGGGYIGSEIASALAQTGATVTMLFPEDVVQQRMFPRSLAQRITDAFSDKGVDVRPGVSVTAAEVDGNEVVVRLEGGDEVRADAVVVGAGLAPSTELADGAGIDTDNGIVVDEQLRTSVTDLFAAGDVASYPDALLGRRRVEHVDNAEKMGERAGRNAAGESEAYTNTPLFWSDIFDYGYEAVGDLDASLETVEDWDDGGDAGVVYYLDDGRVRGVLLWNVWDHSDDARAVISSTRDGGADAGSLKGRIPLG